MATRTKPLIASAALATAAAVVIATPAVAPSVSAPTPPALASAQVELATFSDLLSITPEDWSNILFTGWGFALSPDQIQDFDWANEFLNPFVNCNFNCAVTGPSGVAYAALDALINGNGQGIGTVNGVLEDPDKPYQPDPDKPDYNPYVIQPWRISAVNYFFEGGLGPGATYLALQPFGNPSSPLYNPALAQTLAVAAQGLPALTILLIAGLDTVARLAQNVPLVGPYIYGAIQAALGPNSSDEFFGDWGYFGGLSGVLRYVTDVILTGGNPYPPYGPPVTAPVEAAAGALVSAAAISADAVAEAQAAAPVAEADVAEADVAEAADAGEAADTAPVGEVADPAPVAEVDAAPAVEVEATPVAEVEAEAAPAAVAEVAEAAASAEGPAEVDITPADVKSAAKDAPAATAGDNAATGGATGDDAAAAPAAEVAAEAPAKVTNRSMRGALQRAGKSIGSALKSAVGGAASAEKAATDAG